MSDQAHEQVEHVRKSPHFLERVGKRFYLRQNMPKASVALSIERDP
jgi:hypothetical protein